MVWRALVWLDHGLEQISKVGLLTTLASMLGFSLLSIVLRWCGQSWMWVDPLVRHLVLVCAFFGGSLATSGHKHIKIDLLTRIIENATPVIKNNVERFISLVALAVCLGLAESGRLFWQVEQEFGGEAFLGLSSHHLVALIPFGFALLALRYAFAFVLSFSPVNKSNGVAR